jgi:hypothetical protein
MVCCSANPFYLQRHVCRRFFSIHPKSITSAERRTKFRLNVQSRYSGSVLAPAVTTPANQAFPGVLAAAFKTLRGAPATIAYAPNP